MNDAVAHQHTQRGEGETRGLSGSPEEDRTHTGPGSLPGEPQDYRNVRPLTGLVVRLLTVSRHSPDRKHVTRIKGEFHLKEQFLVGRVAKSLSSLDIQSVVSSADSFGY